MGNQLIKNYNIIKDPSYKGGHDKIWQIYSGTKQDSSKKQVSIFQMEKKIVDKKIQNKEEIFDLLKKEAQAIMKFKHPYSLSVLEPILTYIAFITEYFQYPLSHLFDTNKPESIFGSELELKLHCQEILSALQFFHQDAKTVHLGICPQNIYITKDNRWKIGGMLFSQQIQDKESVQLNFLKFNTKINMEPDQKYSAPEIKNSQAYFKSDVFSFGVLMLNILLFQQNRNISQLFSLQDQQNSSKIVNQLNCSNQLKQLILLMIEKQPQNRPTVIQVLNNAWFNDPFLQTIKHLEKIIELSQNQQINLLKGLVSIINQTDVQIVQNHIIPSLNNVIQIEYLQHHVLSLYYQIISNEKFSQSINLMSDIYPQIKKLISGKEMSAQALFIIISKVQILCQHVNKTEIQENIVPLFIKSFECNIAKLQIAALSKTQEILKVIDYLSAKSQILPRLLKLCTKGNQEIQMSSLITINKILLLLDKHFIFEQLIPSLDQIRKVGANYEQNMIIIEIYKTISQTAEIEVIAQKFLPFVIPNLANNNLQKQEFFGYLEITKTLIDKIEKDRASKYLDQVDEKKFDMNIIDQQFQVANDTENNYQNSNNFDFLKDFDNQVAQQQYKAEINLPDLLFSQKNNDMSRDLNMKFNKIASEQIPIFEDSFNNISNNFNQKNDNFKNNLDSVNLDFFSDIKQNTSKINQNLQQNQQKQDFRDIIKQNKQKKNKNQINDQLFENNLNQNYQQNKEDNNQMFNQLNYLQQKNNQNKNISSLYQQNSFQNQQNNNIDVFQSSNNNYSTSNNNNYQANYNNINTQKNQWEKDFDLDENMLNQLVGGNEVTKSKFQINKQSQNFDLI